MSEWQPIETAPRDGSEIVGCNEWAPGKWDYWIVWWSDGWDDGGNGERPNPSYWMPLSPPNS